MTYRQAQSRAGRAGRGKCKARSREQAQAAARVRWDRVRAAAHVRKLSPEGRRDMAAGQWDEVMTDRLYAACGAETVGEMSAARLNAQAEAAKLAAETEVKP